MAKKKKKQSYIIKDPFNLFAFLVVFICILLKELFIFHENGIFGVGLYNSCLICIAVISLIFILAIKEAMGKAVIFRKSRGQIKNALQFVRLNSVLSFWIGVAGAVCLLLIGNLLRTVLNIKSHGLLIMFFLSVSLPFLLLISSYIGAFKAWGYSMPLNSGMIVFFVSDFLFSILCSVIIGKAGGVNSALFHDEHILAAYSGGGAALGFTVASVVTAIWMSMLFKIFRGHIKIDLSDEFGRNYESIHDQKLGFFVSLGIPAWKSLLSVIPYLFFLFFVFRFYPVTDTTGPDYVIPAFGTFSIQILLWNFIPIVFSYLLAEHADTTLRYITARDDRYHGSMRLLFLMKQFICFVLPVICFVGLITCDLSDLFFEVKMEEVYLITIPMIALAALSMLLAAYMRGFELVSALLISRTAGAVAEFVYLFFVVRTDCTFVNLILSLIIYFGCICLLELINLYKFFVYKKQLGKHIVIPLISCVVYVFIAYFILYLKDSIGLAVSAVIAFVTAFIAQSLILVLSDAVKESEKNDYPQKVLLNLIGSLFRKY